MLISTLGKMDRGVGEVAKAVTVPKDLILDSWWPLEGVAMVALVCSPSAWGVETGGSPACTSQSVQSNW